MSVKSVNSSNSTSNELLLEDARGWFNGMDTSLRNQMILNMYKICMHVNVTKASEHINSQWIDKFIKIEETNKQLVNDLEIQKNLVKSVRDDSNVIYKINEIETNLLNTINTLTSKIAPGVNCKIGEDYIEEILGRIPNIELVKSEIGDFIITISDISAMIESKNWSDNSFKNNKKELEKFKQDAILAKNEKQIHFAVLALHRVTDIKGKTMEIEILPTKTGPLILIYITNLFNHHERILYAIDIGILLYNQRSQNNSEINDQFLYKIDIFFKCIETMDDSIKERNRNIRETLVLIKKDQEHIDNLKQMLTNIVPVGSGKSNKDKLLTLCHNLVVAHGENYINKNILESTCVENNIPPRLIRDIGGVKYIKQMINDKINMRSELE
jgi:hypothetical protein